MRVRKHSFFFFVAVLSGCSAQEPLTARTPNIEVPLVADTDGFASVDVEITDNVDWWVLDGGYKSIVIDTHRHGFFDDILCPPDFNGVAFATVVKPKPHPFIRENLAEAEGAQLLRERAAGVRVVLFDLAPLSLDELEEDFLEEALPRVKHRDPSREPSYSCYGLRH